MKQGGACTFTFPKRFVQREKGFKGKNVTLEYGVPFNNINTGAREVQVGKKEKKKPLGKHMKKKLDFVGKKQQGPIRRLSPE